MGTNNSKENSHHLTLQSIDNNNNNNNNNNSKNNTWQSFISNKTIIYCGWQEIYRCSHSEWLHGISHMFGFVQHKFVCNSELHNVCAPGFCSESLSRKLHHSSYRSSVSKRFQPSSSTKSRKLREHFEYNHIPAMISSLQNYSVHGIVNGCSISGLNHGDTIMLLIYSAVLDKTKFIIVDLKLNRYVCALGDDYNGLIAAKKVHAAWSMDRTQVVIRVPIGADTAALDFYKIVKKESKLYRRITPIDINAQFQFTPNYWTSRLLLYTNTQQTQITITNYNITSLTSTTSNTIQIQTIPLHQQPIGSHLSLVNIHSWSTYNTESIPVDDGFHLLSLLYTFDSVYIILVFSDSLCHCNQTFPLSYFDIYHANTFQRLHRINTQLMSHLCSWHMCQNMFTPIFSVSSSRMAYCTTKNNDGRELQISIVVLPNEMNLKSICRRLIVDYLHEADGNVEDVASKLPYRLSQYIQYRPEYQ